MIIKRKILDPGPRAAHFRGRLRRGDGLVTKGVESGEE